MRHTKSLEGKGQLWLISRKVFEAMEKQGEAAYDRMMKKREMTRQIPILVRRHAGKLRYMPARRNLDNDVCQRICAEHLA